MAALLAALESGHAAELEQGALRFLARHPQDVLARSLLAASLQMQGRVEQAAQVHAELTRRQPGEAAHWNNLGNALRELGRADPAREAYLRARALDPRDALTHHNLGLMALDVGDYAGAREHLLDACVLDPDGPALRIHAAMACHECGDFQRERDLLAPWPQWQGLDQDAQQDLAWLLAQDGQTDAACTLLAGCAAQLPHPQRALARLVLVLERSNRLEQARQVVAGLPPPAQVSDVQARQDVLNARAVMAMREGQWDQARQDLETLLSGVSQTRKVSNLYFALARVYDRLRMPDQAMAACAQAHAAQIDGIRPLVPEAMAHGGVPLPVAQARWSPRALAAAIPVEGPSMLDSPVFVVGFPRSGTTLLEQMLDAHPALRAMDEQPFLQGLVERLEQRGMAWPDGLGQLDQAACDALRADYWQHVSTVVQLRPGQRLVDKNPLNLLRIALIHRLFPRAKIILALRHPCDVLLSCYMQAFRSPAFAMLCSDLGRLAQGYADAMAHWTEHAALLAPAVIESRYEDLVGDVQGQVARLGAFLELDQPERLLDFQRHARDKGYISTPSYSQVVEGIHRGSVGRWEPYRPWFEPVLPVLSPYLERWGYSG